MSTIYLCHSCGLRPRQEGGFTCGLSECQECDVAYSEMRSKAGKAGWRQAAEKHDYLKRRAYMAAHRRLGERLAGRAEE